MHEIFYLFIFYLFKECMVVKALWFDFGGRWNVRIDHWPSMSIFQLVQFVVYPPPNFLSTELTETQFQTMVVVIWEQIWSIRNKVIFKKAKVKIDVLLAVIEKKFQEHVEVLEQQKFKVN